MVPAQEARPDLKARRPNQESKPGTPTARGRATEGRAHEPIRNNTCVLPGSNKKKNISDSRALSTRALDGNRWKIFSEWCRVHIEVPESSSEPIILQFLENCPGGCQGNLGDIRHTSSGVGGPPLTHHLFLSRGLTRCGSGPRVGSTHCGLARSP